MRSRRSNQNRRMGVVGKAGLIGFAAGAAIGGMKIREYKKPGFFKSELKFEEKAAANRTAATATVPAMNNYVGGAKPESLAKLIANCTTEVQKVIPKGTPVNVFINKSNQVEVRIMQHERPPGRISEKIFEINTKYDAQFSQIKADAQKNIDAFKKAHGLKTDAQVVAYLEQNYTKTPKNLAKLSLGPGAVGGSIALASALLYVLGRNTVRKLANWRERRKARLVAAPVPVVEKSKFVGPSPKRKFFGGGGKIKLPPTKKFRSVPYEPSGAPKETEVRAETRQRLARESAVDKLASDLRLSEQDAHLLKSAAQTLDIKPDRESLLKLLRELKKKL